MCQNQQGRRVRANGSYIRGEARAEFGGTVVITVKNDKDQTLRRRIRTGGSHPELSFAFLFVAHKLAALYTNGFLYRYVVVRCDFGKNAFEEYPNRENLARSFNNRNNCGIRYYSSKIGLSP